ncbi:cysteine dioxygenase type 1-like [Saccostrea cucullata]|uniref:cysteine dioxygenase type 1-like n=1 Tax=Saccostrea cuccullata TaxID=36930 RepID=UPI002ED101E3
MARYDLKALRSDLCKELANGFQKESVEMVKQLRSKYKSHPGDWEGMEIWSKDKYTRTLLDNGNGHYNLLILCWNSGQKSQIHNHPNSHCFMKTLKGEVFEELYKNPDMTSCERSCGCKMEKIKDSVYSLNDVALITDADGLHRVGSKSQTEGAVTLHLYSPPFSSCRTYDDDTGKSTEVSMEFDKDLSQQCCARSCCGK